MASRRAFLVALGVAACLAARSAVAVDTIFELRNYTLHPGQRDVLIELFEREFVESQEAVGARIVGTFRDLDAPDHFVWLRSFADMEARAAALNAFYKGPVWRAHRAAANVTMIDSDDVLLLHPVGAPLELPSSRPPADATAVAETMYVADVYPLLGGAESDLRKTAMRDARVIAVFATEQSPNNFPALPVRDEVVLVVLRRFARVGPVETIAGMPVPQATLRLQPTARSLLR
jgi:hypothetical protein